MTKINVNSAPRQLRSALARLISDFAQEKGIKPVGPRRARGETRLPRRATRDKKRRRRETAAPEPDIQWLDRGRAVWKFYILPDARALRRLCPDSSVPNKAVICADSSGNLGVIDPARLLDFLERSGAAFDKNTLRSLAEDVPAAPALPSDFHFKGTVQKNHQFLKDHYSLRIRAGFVPKPAAGQFLQLLCDPAAHAASPKYKTHSHGERKWPTLHGAELLSQRPFLRRPFSVASYGPPAPRDDLKDARRLGAGWLDLVNWLESEFEVIYRRVPGGPGTGALANYRVGSEIDVVGPLGKGFNLAPLPDIALLVGGGVGATPLLFLAEELVRSGVEVRLFVGAGAKARIPFRLSGAPKYRIPRFDRLGMHTIICTDDGSAGKRSLVTDPLVQYLEKKSAKNAKIFACGPRPMLAALEGIATRYDVPCEVLLEERMACGFGACISCVCGAKETGRTMRFTRICTEGPAFDAKKVMWHA